MEKTTIIAFKILRPIGLLGNVRVKCFIDKDKADDYSPFFDKFNNNFIIKTITAKCDYHQVKFVGIDSRDDAEKLRGLELFFNAEKLASTANDEFYISTLINCPVFIKNEKIGQIVGVDNFGSDDLINILTTSDNKEYYVPFTDDCFKLVTKDSAELTDFGYESYILSFRNENKHN